MDFSAQGLLYAIEQCGTPETNLGFNRFIKDVHLYELIQDIRRRHALYHNSTGIVGFQGVCEELPYHPLCSRYAFEGIDERWSKCKNIL